MLLTDPSRISNIIHNPGILYKWLLDFVVVAVVVPAVMLFGVSAEIQTRATFQGGFRGRTGSFYSVYRAIFPQTSDHVMSWLETLVGNVANLFYVKRKR